MINILFLRSVDSMVDNLTKRFLDGIVEDGSLVGVDVVAGVRDPVQADSKPNFSFCSAKKGDFAQKKSLESRLKADSPSALCALQWYK